ncbi:hypothetical protein PV08_12081 [Exophiala spinifera]|uniref:Uncharacterized protein n=1 Tax=Exophiala spinifera TaxID=91928 RepID=A0A0D1Y3Z4_9EURO|nr:uncharacterized protein PV08_12081 [Exophiala spinifera]KIW09666.1 hypothetical protein PV08_12081 [Exophiala spinifera]
MPEKPKDDSAKVPKESTSSSPGNNNPAAQNGAARSPTPGRSDTSFMQKVDSEAADTMKFPKRKEK